MKKRLIGVIAAMIALLSAALATGGRIYYNLFFLLLTMIVFSAVSVVWMLFSVRVGIKGVKTRVSRGERLTTIVSVQHRCLLPMGRVRVILSAPGSTAASQEISVNTPPFAKKNYRNVVRCPHRGSYELGVARIAVGDIFSFFEFSRKSWKKPLRVEVYPRAAEAPCMQLKASDMGPEFKSRATEDNASPSDVRAWQDGDELKKVHWKLSLRKQELMVRSFEESARPDTLIIPDLSEITALNDQRLTIEDCICEAALSAAKAQLEEGFPVRMPLISRRPQELSEKTVVGIGGMTDALMRVKFDSPYPYEQVLSLMLQRMQRTGGCILITGRLSTHTVDMALRMQRSGMQVKLIWITDARRSDTLEMLERMKMSGVIVEQADPWLDGGYNPAKPEEQKGLDEETIFDI